MSAYCVLCARPLGRRSWWQRLLGVPLCTGTDVAACRTFQTSPPVLHDAPGTDTARVAAGGDDVPAPPP